MNRVAVFGASGFVGTALYNHLAASSDWDVVPVIHSSGNAWELSRRGLELRTADLMVPAQIDEVLAGCSHVVNCTRGPDAVMLEGVQNLVNACRKARVTRFVHLSSVAVYGDPPRAESSSERAEPKIDNAYARVKLAQDVIVEKAARRGLSAVVLCPPNISGAGSDFVIDLVEAMRSGRFGLVEGRWPVNQVDVRNLAAAIVSALSADAGAADDGKRLFVTDGESIDWATLAGELSDMSGAAIDSIRRVSESFARASIPEVRPPAGSVLRSIKHLVSGSVRAALREDPYLAKLDKSIRKLVPGFVEDRARYWLNGPIRVRKVHDDIGIDTAWLQLQLRGVEHDCTRARDSIGYRPVLSFAESVGEFRNWYRAYHGWDTDTWPLALELGGIR